MFFPRSKVHLTFLRGRSSFAHFLILSAFSVLLMFVDARFQEQFPLRIWLMRTATPVYYLIDLPVSLFQNIQIAFSAKKQLTTMNHHLRHENVELSSLILRFQEINEENKLLKDLLQAPIHENVMARVANPIRIKSDHSVQQWELDLGRKHGVRLGMPVFDAKGVVGVISQTNHRTSRMTLITDPSTGIPVKVLRNGIFAVAEGVGTKHLKVRHIADDGDVEVGDLMVTSGLGGRFPPGYPVGVVVQVEHVPGEPFLEITLRPSAQLNRLEPLLVLFTVEEEP